MLLIKKWSNEGFPSTKATIELRKMTFYRVNLDLKPFFKDYKSLLSYEELDRAKFSLCDHYSTICVSIIVLTIFKIPSSLYNKTY